MHYSISLRNMGNIFEQISLDNISAEKLCAISFLHKNPRAIASRNIPAQYPRPAPGTAPATAPTPASAPATAPTPAPATVVYYAMWSIASFFCAQSVQIFCAQLFCRPFLDFKAKGKNSDLVEMYCLKIYLVSPPFWAFFLLLTIRANIFSIRGTIRYTIVIEDDFLCSFQWPLCSGIIIDWPCQVKSLSDGTFKAWWHQTPSVI